DLDRVRAAVRPTTRVIVVNFPHNPTGATIDRRALDELVAIADNAGAVLVSDEVYRGLERDVRDRLPPAVTLSKPAWGLGVLSKSYALAGLRVGWLAIRDAAVRARIASYKDYLSICSSAPSEVLAIAALRAKDRILERSRAIVAQNLALLDDFFERR